MMVGLVVGGGVPLSWPKFFPLLGARSILSRQALSVNCQYLRVQKVSGNLGTSWA